MRRAAALTLVVLGLGEATMAAALVDDLPGHGWAPPLVCALIVASAVAILAAARRRQDAGDPATARALVVLGAGTAFAALAATALLLAVYSTAI